MRPAVHRLRRARRAAALLCALLAGAALSPLPARSASTLEDEPRLRVVLESLTPAVATPGKMLAITGRVSNESATAVREASVRLRVSTSTVVSRLDLQRLSTGESVRDGRVVTGTTRELGDLAPGAGSAFEIRLPLDQLGLGATAVHPMTVEARGRPDGASSEQLVQQLGLARTQLPWASSPARVERTRLAWLWPLVDVPHRRADGVFLDEDLAVSVAPGGRLFRLLDAVAGRRGITLVLDPMLVDDLAAMEGGYRVVAPPGSASATVPGTGQQAAAAYLALLRRVVEVTPMLTLPYGDPDVAALVRAGRADLLEDARERAAEVLQSVLARAGGVPAALPPGGWANGAIAAALSGAQRRPLVLTDAALAPVDTDYTPTGRARLPGGTAVALTDSGLSALAERAATPAEPVLDPRRFLTETAVLALERPGTVRTVAVLPPRRWNPADAALATMLRGTASAPWLAPATLPELLAEPVPPIERSGLSYPAEARDTELAAAAVQDAAGLADRVGVLVSLLQDAPTAAALADGYHLARLRLVSASLRERPTLAGTLQDSVERSLDSVLLGVTVLPADVQLPSLSGDFRVTVSNDTPYDVVVRVRFSTDQPRIRVQDSAAVLVARGSKDAVTVSARALARGAADVQAHVASPDGTRLGSSATVRIRVTEYGRAALAVTLGAAALLLLAATRNVVRRVRPPARRGRHAG